MVTKYMRRCSASYIIKAIELQMQMRYSYISISKAKLKKS